MDLTEKKTYQERMADRIRESIGELITDEELSILIKKATEDFFFKPTELKQGFSSITEPAFIHQVVKELLSEKVEILIKEYFSQNKDTIEELIKEIVSEGIGNALLKAISVKFENHLYDLQYSILNSIPQNKGL